MEQILERLKGEAWVRGSMIVSDEGMVVMENLGDPFSLPLLRHGEPG